MAESTSLTFRSCANRNCISVRVSLLSLLCHYCSPLLPRPPRPIHTPLRSHCAGVSRHLLLSPATATSNSIAVFGSTCTFFSWRRRSLERRDAIRGGKPSSQTTRLSPPAITATTRPIATPLLP